MENAVIVSAVRTPTGKFLGTLKEFTAPQLGALVVREAVRRAGIDPAAVEECIMGNVVSAGVGQAPARQAAILGGVPAAVPAVTVNKVCGSGLKAVMLAAQSIRAGDQRLVVAGGMESMSNVPHYLRGLRQGVKLGDQASYNGKTVRVAAVTQGYPNMMQATVVMSRDTLRMLGEANTGERVGPLMVQIKDPARAPIVVAQLNSISNGQFKAWTRQDLAKANEGAMMKESFIAIMLGFSLFLGVLIGVAITWQTLRGAIMANIKEFASLRALGVAMGSLRWIVLELSFWVGIAGVLAAFVLTWGVSLLAAGSGLTMSFPPMMVMMVSLMLIVIALLSGLLSLGVLKNSQPADLLR